MLTRAALFFLAAGVVFGDGGTMLFRQQAGPFVITAFAEPAPVRVGVADISTMVQRETDQSTVLDAKVSVHLKQSAPGKIVELVAPATHANATNKLLYAAHLNIPSTGEWTLSVDVSEKQGAALASTEINILPPEPAGETYWPYFLFVPLGILVFVLNRWLRKKFGVRNPRARP